MSTRKHEKNKVWFYPFPPQNLPPKKSTVILFDKSTGKLWNEAAK